MIVVVEVGVRVKVRDRLGAANPNRQPTKGTVATEVLARAMFFFKGMAVADLHQK